MFASRGRTPNYRRDLIAQGFGLIFGLMATGTSMPVSAWAQGFDPGPITHVPMQQTVQPPLAVGRTILNNPPLSGSLAGSTPTMPSIGLGGIGHQVDPGRVMNTNECTPGQRRRAKRGQLCYVRQTSPAKKKVTRQKTSPTKKQASTVSRSGHNDQVAHSLPLFEPEELVVAFPSQTNDQAIDYLSGRYGLRRIAGSIIDLIDLRVVRFSINGQRRAADILPILLTDPQVVFAQFNYVYGAAGSNPDLYPTRLLNLQQVQSNSQGVGTKVAVIDSPIDASHPGLKDSIIAMHNVSGASNVKPDEHGTVIAGIIAGNGKVKGVASASKILAINAFVPSRFGNLLSSNTFFLMKSIDWAATQGADVINMSFAGPHDPLLETILNAASAKKIVMVAAVGNDGPKAEPSYPAAYETVIGVTAVDAKKRLFDQATRGDSVLVAAPGVRILSTKPGGMYGFMTGTSMAAAYVSGIAALMLEQNRGLGGDELAHFISDTAQDLGEPGRDNLYGHGLVDALAAVNLLSEEMAAERRLSSLGSH